MAILAAYTVPHPPLAVPQVGRGKERDISATLKAFGSVAAQVAALAPDTLVISSPHATLYADYLSISSGPGASGSFAQFGAPTPRYEVRYDQALVRLIASAAKRTGLAAGTAGRQGDELDHGVLVPLHFLQAGWSAAHPQKPFPQVVRLGLSGLGPADHYQLGKLVQECAAKLKRRVVYIASGDCSHKLTQSGPYGFSPAGPEFETKLEEWLAQSDFLGLLTCDPELAERAAECGLRSFQIMAGALDRTDVAPTVLSHEGPFGVGYLVSQFEPVGEEASDTERAFDTQLARAQALQDAKAQAHEGLLCALARASIEAYVREGRRIEPNEALPSLVAAKGEDEEETLALQATLAQPAACFVSLKKHGELRGCIGTLAPTKQDLAHEICANAISAATADPRFTRVAPAELTELVLDVDVLSEPEPVSSLDELDAARYGVIVAARDGRRGVLLPDLAGVDSVEEQVTIAAQKGGIDPRTEPLIIQRFSVERHL